MAVRDLLWGCPICRAPGAIRPVGRRERCRACGADFRRTSGARILVRHGEGTNERSAEEWMALLGPVAASEPDADGVILGPERVRVKVSRRQEPLRWAGELLGWVEIYDSAGVGSLTLFVDGLRFLPANGEPVRWPLSDLTGIQPASSSLQLGLHHGMASVKFLEGSVRLWTRALSDQIRDHYRRQGRDLLELQPSIRTCEARTA
jgi:hypothetical protein